ncbi:MAG: hypothetical protein WC994_06680 [Brumimicrobium sp.]
MRKLSQLLFVGFFLFFGIQNQALTQQNNVNRSVEVKDAKFPGGDQEMIMFITENINYQKLGKQNEKSIDVRMKVVIGKDGKVLNAVVHADNISEEFKDELKKAALKMPKWYPATYAGTAVESDVIISLKF